MINSDHQTEAQVITDDELLQNYVQRRDSTAFEELVRRHSNLVYSTCLRILSNRDAAEDAAQAAFIVFAQKAASLSGQPALPIWLYQTARNASRDLQRSNARRSRREKVASMSMPATERNESSAWETVKPFIDEVLETLPSEQRDAVVLRYFKGLSEEDAACIASCPPKTMRTRLSRAIERLRAAMERRGIAITGASLLVMMTDRATVEAPTALAGKILAACKHSQTAAGASAAKSLVSIQGGLAAAKMWALAALAVIGVSASVAYFCMKPPGAVASQTTSRILIYPPIPGLKQSAQFTVNVTGRAVPAQTLNGLTVARFACDGPITISVSLPENVQSYTLSPKYAGIQVTESGRQLWIDLKAPANLILRDVNGRPEELALLMEPLPGARVAPRNSVDMAATAGQPDAAPQIQAAIDSLSARNGGVVYFPEGEYLLKGSIFLKSNIELQLAAGSVIAAATEGKFADRTLIVVNDAVNATINGPGVIYGGGTAAHEPRPCHYLIAGDNCRNLRLQDTLLIDPGVSVCRFCDTSGCTLDKLKLIMDRPNTAGEGIDIDSSQDIVLSNLFIYTDGDCISQSAGTGNRKTVKALHGIQVRDSVLSSANGLALKIGPYLAADLSDASYTHIDVVRAKGLTGVFPMQGGNVEAVVYRDIRIEKPGDRLFSLLVQDAEWGPHVGALGSIQNIRFEDIASAGRGSRNPAIVSVDSAHPIEGVTFSRVTIAGKDIKDPSSFKIEGSVKGISFK